MNKIYNYIIFLEPIYHEKVWGGNNIKNKYHQELPNNLKIGESWEISSNKNGDNKVLNENFKNMSLSELFKQKKELFGKNFKIFNDFPLLIKYIDANENLSVQLHPSKKNTKNECWYVIDAIDDAKIVYGLTKNFTKAEFQEIMDNNKLKYYLNYKAVKTGDFIFIPSGLIHALLKGIFVIEIQENCDTTYRLYDWDRNSNRKLHIKEGVDNIIPTQTINNTFNVHNLVETNLINSKYFKIDKIKINNYFALKMTNNSCILINVITCSNDAYIKIDEDKLKIKKGISFILLANQKTVEFLGNLEIIKTWI